LNTSYGYEATIADNLSNRQRLTIEYNIKEQGQVLRNHLWLCSNSEPEHRQIYQGLGFI